MKNFQKKENNLNNLIDKLSHIHKSYSHFEINNDHLVKEKHLIENERAQLEKKNIELIREHKFLRDKILRLETELKSKMEIEYISKICSIASEVFDNFPDKIYSKITEREATSVFKKELINNGADYILYMACLLYTSDAADE